MKNKDTIVAKESKFSRKIVKNNEKKYSLKNFLKENQKTFLIIFIISFLTYSIKLFTYSFSIDTEDLLLNKKYLLNSWLSISRYGLVFIKKFLDIAKFNLIVANWIGFIFMFLSVILTIYNINNITKKNNIIANILLGSIIMTSPIMVEQFNFTLQCVEIYMILFLLNIAFLILNNCAINRNKYYLLVFPILVLALAFACYQSFVLLTITLSAFYIMLIYNETKEYKFSTILIYVLTFLCALILYKILDKVVLSVTGIKASSYLSKQILWGKIRKIEVIKSILNAFVVILTGKGNIYYNAGLLFCIVVFIINIKKDFSMKKWLNYVGIFTFFISPFLLIILTGILPVARSEISVIYVTGLGIYYIFSNTDKELFKGIIIGVFGFIIINQFVTSVSLFYTDYVAFIKEKELAKNIVNDLEELNLQDKPVAFVGPYSVDTGFINVKGEVMGHTFFEWDYGTEIDSNRRIQGFLKVLGYNLKYMNNEDYKEIKEKALEMEEVYPEKGYIKDEDDYVIIKLNR